MPIDEDHGQRSSREIGISVPFPTIDLLGLLLRNEEGASIERVGDRAFLTSLAHSCRDLTPLNEHAPERTLGGMCTVASQWQWKNSLPEPSGRTLKWSTLWLEKVEPSEPVPRTLNVNVPFTVDPFALKPPQVVNLPV